MTNRILRRTLALAALAAAACSDGTGPLPPFNATAMSAELAAVAAASGTDASTSLSVLGTDISDALTQAGGALGVAGLPSIYLKDPTPARRTAEQWASIRANGTTAAVIPAAALGKTFVYDTLLNRYVVSELSGAPANGVRFILYAVDPLTELVVEPLVVTGYVDLTRTVSDGVSIARVEAYAGGASPVKVLDYEARVSGAPIPTARVQGFAKNGTDSLAFDLRTSISLAASTLGVDWRSEVPTREFKARVVELLHFNEASLGVEFDGLLRSGSGQVTMRGTIDSEEGGAIIVRVNHEVFARIAFAGGLEDEPVVTDADGEPLTPEEVALLQDIFEWFSHAFDFFNALLAPVETLVDTGGLD